MLFDLQGKRRRVVQGTYLMLAVLMGGGLVFFGIGGDVSGGLFDAFSDRGGGGGNGNEVVEKRIERNEKRVAASPQNSEAARKALVRDYYQLAVAQTTQEETGFPADARGDLRKAAANWRGYLKTDPEKVDASLATVALQIFDPSALNKPKDAQEAARLIAEERNDPEAYLRLVQYAALAGDTRVANLAGQKAVDLAPAGQKKEVQQQVKQLKSPQNAAGGAGGAGAATPQQ